MSVPYPEVFWGGWFFEEFSEEKNCITAWRSGGHCKPSSVGSRGKALENFGYLAFCGAQNIVFTAVCDNKQCFTLNKLSTNLTFLRIWGSEFGIPNQYTCSKIALVMALNVFLSEDVKMDLFTQ